MKRFASEINRDSSLSRARIDRILLLAAAAVFISRTAAGQFVPLSRCRDAFPCAIPFAVDHRADPLIAGQYAGPPTSALSVRVPLASPLVPEVETRATDTKAIDDAIRTLLHR